MSRNISQRGHKDRQWAYKKCSLSLVIREAQLKAIKYYLISVGTAYKRLEISTGRDVVTKEP